MMFDITCTVNDTWRAHLIPCPESGLILAGEVSRKVRADKNTGPQLEIEPVRAASLVAVGGVHPGTKEEGS